MLKQSIILKADMNRHVNIKYLLRTLVSMLQLYADMLLHNLTLHIEIQITFVNVFYLFWWSYIPRGSMTSMSTDPHLKCKKRQHVQSM